MIDREELSETQALDLYIPQYCKSPAEIFSVLCTPEVSALWRLEEAHYGQLSCDHLFAPNNIDQQLKFLKGFMDSTLEMSLDKVQLSRFWMHVRELAGNNPEALSSNGMSTFLILERL